MLINSGEPMGGVRDLKSFPLTQIGIFQIFFLDAQIARISVGSPWAFQKFPDIPGISCGSGDSEHATVNKIMIKITFMSLVGNISSSSSTWSHWGDDGGRKSTLGSVWQLLNLVRVSGVVLQLSDDCWSMVVAWLPGKVAFRLCRP